MVNGKETKVFLEPLEHRYFTVSGEEYSSVSKVRKNIKKPFDANMVSYMVAKSRMKNNGHEDIEFYKNQVLGEWKKKNDHSIVVGNYIDGAIDTYFTTTDVVNEELRPMLEELGAMMSGYKKRLTKAVVWSEAHKVAGEIDKMCMVSKDKADYFDYKTNFYKGMEYVNKRGDYMLDPMSHLQDCNYNDLCLQLSIYALMGELCYEVKPRVLSGIYIDTEDNFKIHRIPVPYMKYEAWSILEHWRKNNVGNDNF